MNELTKKKLFDKNDKLINMVIERAKRDFPEDIAIIGLTGSFNTGDFYEKSDLDLIIINNTDRGWDISYLFILDDVGYDIYCTPWETRITEQANLESPMVCGLVDMKILYCAKPEYMDKFNAYKQKALDALTIPVGKTCIGRAKKYIDCAKQEYANTLLVDNIGKARYASSNLVYNLINALTNLNNTYLKRGVKRYLEELATYTHMPEDFEKLYMRVIESKTLENIRSASFELLRAVDQLYNSMYTDFVEHPKPTYDNLKGTYEELWSNYRNKVIASAEENDKSYAFLVARVAQNYLDEMTEFVGIRRFDIMEYFDPANLSLFKEEFSHIMDEYLKEYKRVGRKVERYDSFEQLYNHYMKTSSM